MAISTTSVSCQDSPLSTAANIIGILTFIYAVLLSIYLNFQYGTQTLQTNPALVQEIVQSTEEVQTLATRIVLGKTGNDALVAKAHELANRAATELNGLRIYMGKYLDVNRVYATKRRRWWSQVRLMVEREELRKRVEVKDRMLEDLRRLQQELYSWCQVSQCSQLRSQRNQLREQRYFLHEILKRLQHLESAQQAAPKTTDVLSIDNPTLTRTLHPPQTSTHTMSEDRLQVFRAPTLDMTDSPPNTTFAFTEDMSRSPMCSRPLSVSSDARQVNPSSLWGDDEQDRDQGTFHTWCEKDMAREFTSEEKGADEGGKERP